MDPSDAVADAVGALDPAEVREALKILQGVIADIRPMLPPKYQLVAVLVCVILATAIDLVETTKE